MEQFCGQLELVDGGSHDAQGSAKRWRSYDAGLGKRQGWQPGQCSER